MTSSAGPSAAGIGSSAAVLLLVAAAPRPGEAVRTLQSTGSAIDPLAPVLALVTLLAWALAGWLCLTVVATAGGHLPGQPGRVLAALARRTAPAAVRRAVELALGLTVVVGGLTTPAAAEPGPVAPPSPAASGSVDRGGPTAGSDPEPAAVTAGSATAPDLDWAPPSTGAASPAASSPPAGTVVVRPGDTLWDLAAADLRVRTGAAPTDAQVASAWPKWWAANRDAVGADPHLLLPGTRLSPPTTG